VQWQPNISHLGKIYFGDIYSWGNDRGRMRNLWWRGKCYSKQKRKNTYKQQWTNRRHTIL
jgi:hypothetical protein